MVVCSGSSKRGQVRLELRLCDYRCIDSRLAGSVIATSTDGYIEWSEYGIGKLDVTIGKHMQARSGWVGSSKNRATPNLILPWSLRLRIVAAPVQ
jgi:hypothetical protein